MVNDDSKVTNKPDRKLSVSRRVRDVGGGPAAACEPDDDLTVSDHVRVVVRARPLKADIEQDAAPALSIHAASNAVEVSNHNGAAAPYGLKTYLFSCVADASKDQQFIFRQTGKPIVDCALAGFNGAIVAYGQTGSGKTFTMQGPALTAARGSQSSNGIIQSVCETIFAHITDFDSTSAQPAKFSVTASYLEIYNETLIDLLAGQSPTPDAANESSPKSPRNSPQSAISSSNSAPGGTNAGSVAKLKIREDSKGHISVCGLTHFEVNSPERCYELLLAGAERRTVGSTKMNFESSRSHAVFTLTIAKHDVQKGVIRTSRLHLVDLAGSERQKGTGASGIRLREAGGINKSLSALGNVINALSACEVSSSSNRRSGAHAQPNVRIPSYRDSKLTFLLKDALGGNAKLCLIATISPALSSLEETVSTLEFAKRCAAVRNEAVVNECLTEDVAELQREVRKLQKSLKTAQMNLSHSKATEAELRVLCHSMSHERPISSGLSSSPCYDSTKVVRKSMAMQTDPVTIMDSVNSSSESQEEEGVEGKQSRLSMPELPTCQHDDNQVETLKPATEVAPDHAEKKVKKSENRTLQKDHFSTPQDGQQKGGGGDLNKRESPEVETLYKEDGTNKTRGVETECKTEGSNESSEVETGFKRKGRTNESPEVETSFKTDGTNESLEMETGCKTDEKGKGIQEEDANNESELRIPSKRESDSSPSEEESHSVDGMKQKWKEMIETNQHLWTSLLEREDELLDIKESAMRELPVSTTRRMRQELELLRVRVDHNPEILILRHRLEAYESDVISPSEQSKEGDGEGTERGKETGEDVVAKDTSQTAGRTSTPTTVKQPSRSISLRDSQDWVRSGATIAMRLRSESMMGLKPRKSVSFADEIDSAGSVSSSSSRRRNVRTTADDGRQSPRHAPGHSKKSGHSKIVDLEKRMAHREGKADGEQRLERTVTRRKERVAKGNESDTPKGSRKTGSKIRSGCESSSKKKVKKRYDTGTKEGAVKGSSGTEGIKASDSGTGVRKSVTDGGVVKKKVTDVSALSPSKPDKQLTIEGDGEGQQDDEASREYASDDSWIQRRAALIARDDAAPLLTRSSGVRSRAERDMEVEAETEKVKGSEWIKQMAGSVGEKKGDSEDDGTVAVPREFAESLSGAIDDLRKSIRGAEEL